MKNLNKLVFVVILGLCSSYAFADKWQGAVNVTPTAKAMGGCESARTSTDLSLNNVVARVHTGGDMWWDLQGKPKYEVPAGGGVHSLYCSAIWVGGKDANGQLKLAAQRYRQVGIDYWPGPLIISGAEIASVSDDVCRQYDRHFCISKQQVKDFRDWYSAAPEDKDPNYTIPDIIRYWPWKGPDGRYDYHLAPFYDSDGNGEYDPAMGDFPYFEFATEGITDDPDCLRPRGQAARLFGDYSMWWVYNDKGNIHTETGGAAIGFEFRAQAFAFQTNDALNDMTFYNYRIINRSTYTLYNTYFGVFVDGDLGNGYDDYVGCDVQRGLGFFYNGDEEDQDYQGSKGYGSQPPAIGIDFFEGPYQDPDGLDNSTSYVDVNGKLVLDCTAGDFKNGNINGLNFGDGTIDNERWGMRRFIYFNNTGKTGGNTNKTDPETAVEYYNYMTGYWKDNTPLLYGGDGYSSVSGADPSQPTNFMFPGTSDICGWGQDGVVRENWTEETESNVPYDRRLIQAAGPFTLTPGQVNDITIGAVWARATSGGAYASVEAVKVADDKAQILFENCFRVLDGPDAPEINIVELDRKLIFHLYNKTSSNNYLEGYVEKDPSWACGDSAVNPCDQNYYFQGYQVFQYKDKSVSMGDRYNGDKVRQVFQCDVKDGVSKLVNYTWSDDLEANVPQLEVNGGDQGITHTFVLENDCFATGDSRLVNNREYYFSAVAYSYNPSMKYDQNDQATFFGQKTPYLAGRNNIKLYTATPHLTSVGGTIIQGEYGYGPQITMMEGYGNGNNELELTQETIDEILDNGKAISRTYQNGKGPIKIKVIDPLNIVDDTYYVKFGTSKSNSIGTMGTAAYLSEKFETFDYVVYNSDGDSVRSEASVDLGYSNEQLFMNWGFSIAISQEFHAGDQDHNSYNNGVISSSITFADETKPWLNFVADDDSYQEVQNLKWTNWIRTGTFRYPTVEAGTYDLDLQDFNGEDGLTADAGQNFEKICGGKWGPAYYVNDKKYGLMPKGTRANMSLKSKQPLMSVDIVITADKSKWTRCCVVEMAENEWSVDDYGFDKTDTRVNYNSEGGALKFALRKHKSVDKDGNEIEDGTHGMGWFPGYAIDVTTGERLNIMFGEDSWMRANPATGNPGENGGDMIWNPTSDYCDNHYNPILGGKHYIYVMANERESGADGDPDGSNAPAYDECQYIYQKLLKYEQSGSSLPLTDVYKSAMWCAIPMRNSNYDEKTYGYIPTDVTIKIRVATPYHIGKREFALSNTENNNAPFFSFTTSDIKTVNDDQETAENALDLIRVVPNPYYGSSYFESNQLDNRVRITNLPRQCTVSIYNINGTLIRRFKKDTDNPYIEWDLTNSANIVISSGVYLIHVEADGIGEKVLKWFGALRPTDLNNF